MMKQLRNTMLTGLLALLPLYLTVTLLIWLFHAVDSVAQPWLRRVIGVEVWGLGVLATAAIILIAGLIVPSVGGALFIGWMDRFLDRLPIVKGLYRGIKQIVDSFNPSNPSGFKEFVLIKQLNGEGFNAGFLTSEFSLLQEDGSRRDLASVFIPSNHLYLGAVHIVDRARIVRTEMTLQEGATFALSAGGSVKGDIRQAAASKVLP
ncbi:DUF502 domain-containing protein [Candidatus Manganitrophus noduliformans]|nr:DUF502 domain-containing protein [Candidatus Manganitrophus noduliformans]